MQTEKQPSGLVKDSGWWWWRESDSDLWECVMVGGQHFIRVGREENWDVKIGGGTWGGRIVVEPPNDKS